MAEERETPHNIIFDALEGKTFEYSGGPSSFEEGSHYKIQDIVYDFAGLIAYILIVDSSETELFRATPEQFFNHFYEVRP